MFTSKAMWINHTKLIYSRMSLSHSLSYRGMLGGAFWADIKMNSSLLKHEDEVELFLDAVSTGDTETDILDIFYHIEDIRYIIHVELTLDPVVLVKPVVC